MSAMDMTSQNYAVQNQYFPFGNPAGNAAAPFYIPTFNGFTNNLTPTQPTFFGNTGVNTNPAPNFGNIFQTQQPQQACFNQLQPQIQYPLNPAIDQLTAYKLLFEAVWQNTQLLQHLLQWKSQTSPQFQGSPINSEHGRPSSLALECLQMAMTDLHKRSNGGREGRNSSDRLPHHDNHTFRSIQPDPPLIPTRRYGATCIPSQHRNEHYYSIPSSRNSLEQLTWHENGSNRKRPTAFTPLGGNCHRSTPWDRASSTTPAAVRNGFCVDTIATERANRYLSLLHYDDTLANNNLRRTQDCPGGMLSEHDLKWKVLNERVVKVSPEKAVWRKPAIGHWESLSVSLPSGKNNYRNREPATTWKWATRTLTTGPPLKRYSDEDDRKIKNSELMISSRKNTETVANLPGRFTYKHGPQKTLKRCVSSTHKDLKKDVETLYKNVHSKQISNPASQESIIPLTEKTSPVFFLKPKPSLATQTDKVRDDECYFIEQFKRLEGNANKKDNEGNCDACSAVDSAASSTEGSDVRSEKLQMSPPLQLCKSGVKLSGEGYYCLPDLTTLDQKTNEDNTCIVKDFEVGHRQFGKVVFHGYTNVAGLDLDKIVHFNDKLLHLYPNYTDMPRFGEGLHRPCTVTMYNVWPTATRDGRLVSSGDAPDIIQVRDPEKIAEMDYEAILRTMCMDFKAKFLSYSPQTGEWTFMVGGDGSTLTLQQ